MDSRTGEPITAAQATSGVFIWEVPNPLYFKIIRVDRPMFTHSRVFHIQIRANHNLRKALDLHKAYFNFQVWTTLTTASGQIYLSRFKFLVMKFLDNLGVISVNNVIRAVSYATDRQYVNDVLEQHEIKFKFY
ncbi:REn [Merremia mosaic Puerto Rico virus]|uniref:Replication enhancer n=1 Tax=Merremia mosaic Puerto Rico virus TaxID=714309 RepID=F4MJ61_9GEMI|nr:REn [Merremia mosaic Puerto Rico virus]ADC32513.1 REn [Merremia mosaic Puerto Rico virus]